MNYSWIGKKRSSLKIISFAIILLFTIVVSPVDAKIPEVVAKQKRAVVTVYVNDTNGKQVVSEGGFIVDRSGIIVTTCSVITTWLKGVGHSIVVRTEGDRFYPMEDVFSCNYKNNLALLKINAKDLPTVKLAVVAASFKKGTHRVVSEKYIANQLDNYRKLLKKKNHQKLAGVGEESNISARYSKPDRIEERVDIKLDSAESYFLLGFNYDKRSMYREAIEAYKQAIIMKPDYGEAYVNLGLDYDRLGKYPEAIDAYTNAIKVKPDSQSTYNKLGTLYIVLGKYSLALQTFKKAISIDPKNSATHYNLGMTYFLNGDRTSAFEEYIILKEIDKERAQNLFDVMN